MREKLRRIEVLSTILAGLTMILAANCGEVNNTDNFAVVRGRVLNSPADPTGVEGVVVWVESDPNSDVAYVGGDVSVTTNPDGAFEANIYLGYMTIRDRPEEGEGTEGGGTFNVDFPQYVGDAHVIMFYEDRVLDLGGGFTLQRGSTTDVWDVYLTEFGQYGGGGEEVVGGGQMGDR